MKILYTIGATMFLLVFLCLIFTPNKDSIQFQDLSVKQEMTHIDKMELQ
jgi:hypothetical protein